MESRRGRRRKIEAEDLSLFGEALEDIFKRGDLIQKEVAIASGLADSTLSQMKVGVRLTRNNIRKLIEGLIKIRFLTSDNLELTANKLLELASEKPLNNNHKRDADVIELLSKFQQNSVNTDTGGNVPLFGKHQVVIAIPAIECVISYEGKFNYRVKKVFVK